MQLHSGLESRKSQVQRRPDRSVSGTPARKRGLIDPDGKHLFAAATYSQPYQSLSRFGWVILTSHHLPLAVIDGDEGQDSCIRERIGLFTRQLKSVQGRKKR